MSRIELDHVTKIYDGGGPAAVSELDLAIDDGEFMVLVGPSGCGKTTALRMVAGLESITAGELRIGDRVVTDVAPRDRDIAMVFQNYALYPHLSVKENMAFGLRLAKTKKAEVDARVREAAHILNLSDYLERKPRALSGGQRQRVAMGRAIVRRPQAFLMDEPLSNLDAKLRVQMRAEIARIQSDLAVTTIYVTHDQVEAMTMGDRVAVLRKGVLQQAGTPLELFDQPVNIFVAGFIGSPAMNLLHADLLSRGQGLAVRFGDHELTLGEQTVAARPALRGYVGREVVLGIRPQDFADPGVTGAGAADRVRGRIGMVEALGTETIVRFTVRATPVLTDDVRELAADVDSGQLDRREAEAESGETELVARLDPRTRIVSGDLADLAVDTERLHFFDLDTGEALYGEPARAPAALSS
jgi:multiple sugar transport system ATP-binding protein